ncbi:MAG: hypothetical protein LBC61_04315 [Candidatus Peribacteria bacterium]|nr:hypothetical protein [Candidatus Peribacteria bacterium]
MSYSQSEYSVKSQTGLYSSHHQILTPILSAKVVCFSSQIDITQGIVILYSLR